mmetsp:Transcript_2237/g.5100  ORF Transcript_2237/g.5100 Transcript_2237/m.5100 type:complete len:154 (-) Transcript_2237:146-607(-)|eukprot:CAMPEP_0114508826 /NCGR_PEP_ID=MMETSP0109-20121206/12841_1 /TAXON_ID=29199 /ORGANISM="Chlorarachnion reptans, Strain CCCM449" /LENGTH=153 /DNA_ID=CAMNT_0001687853 /DNA_START=295 /DNA_END=756 /DNA_ORIENTATION=-
MSRRRKRKAVRDEKVVEVLTVRKWAKRPKQLGHLTLLKWTAVTAGERRTVLKSEVKKKAKKAYERLQRNTNQPLTRSLRSQLSMGQPKNALGEDGKSEKPSIGGERKSESGVVNGASGSAAGLNLPVRVREEIKEEMPTSVLGQTVSQNGAAS